MREVCPTAPFFIPAFRRRYGAAFKLAGDVYEDESTPWVFVEGTQATLGQVFLLGVSWTLNKQRIETMLLDTWKTNRNSLYQYPAWLAYEPDFIQKWPWSDDYDGSEPDIALKHVRH